MSTPEQQEPVRFHNVFASLEHLGETVKRLIAERDAALSDVLRLTAAHTVLNQKILALDQKNKQLTEDLCAARRSVLEVTAH